jgi:cation transport ATPase
MSPDAVDTKKYQCEREANRIQHFFRRPFFLSLTIGIPFCIFKLLFGITAVRTGITTHPILVVFGWCVIAWAGMDFLMNVNREIADLLHKPSRLEYCTIAQLGRYFHAPFIFLAIDTLLAFSIICFMLWSGWITILSPMESYLWSAATTLNLISLSLVSIYNEIQRT